MLSYKNYPLSNIYIYIVEISKTPVSLGTSYIYLSRISPYWDHQSSFTQCDRNSRCWDMKCENFYHLAHLWNLIIKWRCASWGIFWHDKITMKQCIVMVDQSPTVASKLDSLWRHFENNSPLLLRHLGSFALLRIAAFSARHKPQSRSPGLCAGTMATMDHLIETIPPLRWASQM